MKKRKGLNPQRFSKLTLAPEQRDEPSKGAYPAGPFKQVFDVFRAEMNALMRVNMWFMLFLLPLLIVLFWYSRYEMLLTSAQFNFTGNIGVGYPGGGNDAVEGLVAVYTTLYKVIAIALPCVLVMSLGLAGAYNCLKKYMWGESVKSVTRVFFKGIKNYWYKFLAVGAVLTAMLAAGGYSVLNILIKTTLNQATAWDWIAVSAAGLFVLGLGGVTIILMPHIVSHNLPFSKQIKNSFILFYNSAIIGIPLWIATLVPIIFFIKNESMVMVVLYMLMLMFGFTILGLMHTSYAQTMFNNIMTPLYELSLNPKKKGGKKKDKNA